MGSLMVNGAPQLDPLLTGETSIRDGELEEHRIERGDAADEASR